MQKDELYCENCYLVSVSERCPICGKRLRPVDDGDFCLLYEDDRNACGDVMTALSEHEIPCESMPFGSGVESQFGLPLGRLRLYVPYPKLDEAKRLLREMREAETQAQREKLLENVGKLHIMPKLEKKLRKKLKLSESESLIDYCVNIINSAAKIEDGGRIGAATTGRYIFCYADTATLALSDATFEILSVTVKK